MRKKLIAGNWKMYKTDDEAERLAQGKQPHCVEASDGAIVVGDLEDPESDIRQLLNENYTIRRKQSLGTEPSVYYIM